MCLAIPAKVTEMKDNRLATVDILGVTRDISLDLTPQANVGDFVLVHAGFVLISEWILTTRRKPSTSSSSSPSWRATTSPQPTR